MIGRTFSHYKIVDKIGGGMGVVYRAEDTDSHQTVALKLLPRDLTANDDARKRFLREAQAASALEHPNICSINEIGEMPDGRLFICMPFYAGETLRERMDRGPLGIQETVEIAHEVAAGLSYAHEHDIVHRDIKPDNVFITKDGLIKLLDFGLAKLAGDTRLTPAGDRLGTLAYLSPEQARGDEVDHRTDIWSLGAVTYEMLAGKPPFRGGDVRQAVVYSIVNAEPAPLTKLRPNCPRHLEDIIRRCLQKDRGGRFSSLSEFIQQLKILAGSLRIDDALFMRPDKQVPTAGSASTLGRVFWPAAAVVTALVVTSVLLWRGLPGDGEPPRRTTQLRLAVIPLQNSAGEEPGGAFVDGLSETIASAAVAMEPFHESMWVLPCPESASHELLEGGNPSAAFGVNRLLSGEVRRQGNGYRLTLDVIDAATLATLESRHIDFQRESAQSLDADLYDAVADLLHVEDLPEEEPRAPASAASVYESYLEGIGALSAPHGPAAVDEAITSFQQMTGDNPAFARAHVWLAKAYLEKGSSTGDGSWLDRAEASCQTAVRLDSSLVGARVTLADVYRATGRVELAVRFYAEALNVNPRYTLAGLALSDLLASQNREAEAESTYRKMIDVEPDYFEGHRELGRFYHARGRMGEAVAEYETALELAPEDWRTLNRLGAAYHSQGRWDDARELLERSLHVGRRASLDDIQSDPLMAEMRADPRFVPLVQHAIMESDTTRPIGPPGVDRPDSDP